MQTISELNAKWWYRFLKVIYIGGFIVTTVSVTIDIINTKRPEKVIDIDNSYLVCRDGNNKKISFHDVNLIENSNTAYLSLRNIDSNRETSRIDRFINGGTALTVAKLCALDVPANISQIENSEFDTWVANVANSFTLIEVNKTNGDWITVTGVVILWLVIFVFGFEFVRRIFYYIILGKIKAEK